MKSKFILIIIFSLSFISIGRSLSDIRPVDLRVEYLRNPLAVDSPHPRLSWTFEPTAPGLKNLSQKAYQILVSTSVQNIESGVGDLWDSKKVLSDRNTHIKYNGLPLKSGQRAYWTARVWDQKDVPSDISTALIYFWDNGFKIDDWSAEWIGAPPGTQQKALQNISDIDSKVIQSHNALVPVLYLRKHFKTDAPIKSAKLYVTAQGAYNVMINGKLINDSLLSPGWTDFNKTIQYQAYDLTKLMSIDQGNDYILGVILGTGWFSGYIGFWHKANHYGSDQSLLLELHIEYENNKKVIIKTDDSWRVTTGPVIYSDMLMGHLYYENREINGWVTPGYDDKNWLSVVTKPIDKRIAFVADRAQPIRVTQELKPKAKWQSSPGVWVFDFEQNFVGWIKFKVPSSVKTARIQLRHAEVLYPNGTIYTLNLRAALATDTYVLNDVNRKSDEFQSAFEPLFTFHGFRYVEISGYPGEPQLSDLTGIVIGSDTPMTGKFETSSPMVNRLYKNIVWGQRGNFISVPTDCPQRDERLGWMGDGEVFTQTATYNADVSAFYLKWMRDVREGQSSIGGFANISPRLDPDPLRLTDGSPAWGDAGVIVPYFVYRMYGDLDIIEENYESMKRWIDYIHSANPDLIWTKRVNDNAGDWLSVNANTPKEVLSTAYFAYDSLLLSRMADAIGRRDDGQKYRKLHSDIANAFVKHFVNTTDGKIKGDTQTVYLLALAFELLPTALKPKAANNLVENIKAHDWHLTTGFVGVGFLNPILTQYGHNDVAYKLLLQETYPSWGYSVKHNATTIWERWDGWTKEKGFQDPGMNSFNHYSLGSVGRWLFQSVAGIDTDEKSVGFDKIIIRPNPGEGLTFVNAEYRSIKGLIKSSWIKESTGGNQDIRIKVSIPVNTRAVIDLRFSKTGGVHEVGSGDYEYVVAL